jgi:hypothetical protein
MPNTAAPSVNLSENNESDYFNRYLLYYVDIAGASDISCSLDSGMDEPTWSEKSSSVGLACV